MPRFEFDGIGRDTGRKRKRVYEAPDLEKAIAAAAKDGTIVDVQSAKLLPDLPVQRYSRYSKIVGVTFKNRDGSSRQREIKKCRVGEKLELRMERDNPVDPDAVAIHRASTGVQLGYLRRHVIDDLEGGGWNVLRDVTVTISDLTIGGTFFFRRRGVNILIEDKVDAGR